MNRDYIALVIILVGVWVFARSAGEPRTPQAPTAQENLNAGNVQGDTAAGMSLFGALEAAGNL